MISAGPRALKLASNCSCALIRRHVTWWIRLHEAGGCGEAVPLPIAVLAVLVPNLVASAYNIQHNQLLIVSQLSEHAQERFMLVVTLVNLVFFPLGGAVLIYWCRRPSSWSRGACDMGRHRPQKPWPERATTVSSQVIGW